MIRIGLIWSVVTIVAVSALSLYGQWTIPIDQQIAVHWNAAGEADRFGDKTFALWFMPAIVLGVAAIFSAVPFIEPRRGHLLQSSRLYVTGWIGTLIVMTVAHGFVVLTALGYELPVTQTIFALVGLFLAAIGNVLGKSQSNFFVGIRTPWTLSSNEAWDKTHRLAGRLWVLGGLAIAALTFAVEQAFAIYVLLGIVGTMTLIPFVASYFYWRSASDKQTGEA